MEQNRIMTVKGSIKPEELGFCHSHEHLFLADGESAKLNSALRLDDFNKTVNELKLFKEIGGTSIVDAQPVGCGRMADYLHLASHSSDVNIIASTGFHKLEFYPKNHWIHSIDTEELINLYVSELLEGMYIDGDTDLPKHKTGSKAGIIKAASDAKVLHDRYYDLFTAAAIASRRTGSSILTHTEMGQGALEQIEIPAKNGVSPDSIIICHLDRTVKDISYHLEVAKTGVYMEFDTIARFKYHSDEDEAKFIVSLVEKGYEDKILIGLDTTRERMKSYGGSIGLDYISKTFMPLLKNFGLSDEIINKFVIANPAKAFGNKKKLKS